MLVMPTTKPRPTNWRKSIGHGCSIKNKPKKKKKIKVSKEGAGLGSDSV